MNVVHGGLLLLLTVSENSLTWDAVQGAFRGKCVQG